MSTLTVKNIQGVSPTNMVTVPAGHRMYVPGHIIQIQSAIITGTSTYSSAGESTFQDITGLTVNITPTSTSSKVYVLCQVNATGAADNYNAYLRVARNGTGIGTGVAESGYLSGSATGIRNWSQYNCDNHIISFLDSPSSTSTLTYKVQVANGATTYVNRSINGTNGGWALVLSSTITVMEVAQ